MTEAWVPFVVIIAFGGFTFIAGRVAEAAGRRRFESRSRTQVEPNTDDPEPWSSPSELQDLPENVLVLGPSSDRTLSEDMFSDLIRQEIERVGLRATLLNRVISSDPHPATAVLQELTRSRIVIADLTRPDAHTGFWVGIAEALGKVVVIVTTADEGAEHFAQRARVVAVNRTEGAEFLLATETRSLIFNAVSEAVTATRSGSTDVTEVARKEALRRAVSTAVRSEDAPTEHAVTSSDAGSVEARPIEFLDLTVRQFNALTRAGVKVAGDLLSMPDEELRSLKGLHKSSAQSLVELVHALRREMRDASTSEEGHQAQDDSLLDEDHAIFPIYLLVDVSFSMAGDPIEAMNQALPRLQEAIRRDPLMGEMARISLITFSDGSRVVLPLSDLHYADVPPLVPEGGTNYAAAFRTAREEIEDSIRRLGKGKRFYKPVVFFLSDGEHAAEEDWTGPLLGLKDHQWKFNPEIVAFGFGEANPEALKKIATRHAFMVSDLDPAVQVREIMSTLVQSIKATSESLEGDGGELIVEPDTTRFTPLAVTET